MKIKYLFLPVIVAFASMLSSCEDEILLEEEVTEQKTEISKTEVTVEEPVEPVEPVGRLVSATMLSQPVPAGTAISNVMNTVSPDAYSRIDGEGRFLASPEFFKCDLLGINMQLETYRIKYWSKGGKNGQEDVVLTGDIAFIADADRSKKRKLESVSLFHTTFNPSESTSYTWEEMILPTRAAFNALVVYPFYQGSFSDKGDLYTPGKGHTICVSENLIKARQAIDCELAALEFLETLDYVEMRKCYYTENMGISNGAGATLATQFLLENDPEYRAVNRDLIHLKGTFCSAGCYSWGDLMSSVLTTTGDDVPLGDEMVDGMKPVALISCLIGTYDTWKEKYFQGIDIKDFFSEAFLKKPMLKPEYTWTYSWGMEYVPYSYDMSTMTPDDYRMMGETMGLDPEICARIGELAGKLKLNQVSSSLVVSLLGLASSVVGAIATDDSTAIYNEQMAEYYYEMAKYEWGGWSMGTDPISLFRSGDFDNSRPDIATLKIKDILNPKILTADGKKFKTDAPAIQALNKCFRENDVITKGWRPATPLLIVHSSSDSFVDFKQPLSVYKSLSNNGRNKNVEFRDALILGHMSGTVVGILEIMFLKHPCPID